ncbi:MAG: porin family protein [Verrucomicrobia bacterium]|nr:porin family protein [Verrucomicrobiota bacterium]
MKKILSLLTLVLATATVSFAGETVSSKKVVVPADDCRFRAHEWQIDASTVGAAGVYNGQGKQALGGNWGVNYFFTEYLGIGIDNSVGSQRNAGLSGFDGLQAFDTLQADLLLRYPVCSWNLAPYVMVGGGAHWGPASQGDGNVGGGLEWRVLPHAGFFADCRWLYGNNGLTMALPRVGIRVNF